MSKRQGSFTFIICLIIVRCGICNGEFANIVVSSASDLASAVENSNRICSVVLASDLTEQVIIDNDQNSIIVIDGNGHSLNMGMNIYNRYPCSYIIKNLNLYAMNNESDEQESTFFELFNMKCSANISFGKDVSFLGEPSIGLSIYNFSGDCTIAINSEMRTKSFGIHIENEVDETFQHSTVRLQGSGIINVIGNQQLCFPVHYSVIRTEYSEEITDNLQIKGLKLVGGDNTLSMNMQHNRSSLEIDSISNGNKEIQILWQEDYLPDVDLCCPANIEANISQHIKAAQMQENVQICYLGYSEAGNEYSGNFNITEQ